MPSVIVPIYNGARFVERCWATLSRQTLPPYEIIFVDDGSTDGTLEQLRQLPATPLRREVLVQARGGPAAARNVGLRQATGELIAFLDVDDEWPEQKLELAVEAFRGRPEVSVVVGLVQVRWSGGQAPHEPALRAPHRRVNLGAAVFRREVFERHGLLDPTLLFGEDVEFFARLKRGGVLFHDLDTVALHYERHPDNMTRDRAAADRGLFQALARALASGRRKPLGAAVEA